MDSLDHLSWENSTPENNNKRTKEDLLKSLEEKREQQNQETPLEFAARVVEECNVDIDLDFCERHNIKFKETDPLIDTYTEDDLWNRLSDKNNNKKAFDFVTSLWKKKEL